MTIIQYRHCHTPKTLVLIVTSLLYQSNRFKVLQAKSYLRVAADTEHALHEAPDTVYGQIMDGSGRGHNQEKCMLENKMGDSRSAVQPTIMDNPDKVTHNEGDVAVLYCSVLNLGDSTVTWRKMSSSSPLTIGNKSWVRDMRVHAEHVPYSSHWNLVIEQVRAEDAGEYECQVNKRKSQLRQRVTLLVKEKDNTPLPRIEISGQNIVKVGHVLQLTCDVILVDMTVDAVTWNKDGISLPKNNDDRYRVHTSLTMNGQNVGVVASTLEVRNTRHDDSGVYVCRTSEKAQMAGVKVEIQGTHHLKRDDMKVTSLSNRRATEPGLSGYNKTAAYLDPVATNLLCYMFVLLNRYLVYYSGLIT